MTAVLTHVRLGGRKLKLKKTEKASYLYSTKDYQLRVHGCADGTWRATLEYSLSGSFTTCGSDYLGTEVRHHTPEAAAEAAGTALLRALTLQDRERIQALRQLGKDYDKARQASRKAARALERTVVLLKRKS